MRIYALIRPFYITQIEVVFPNLDRTRNTWRFALKLFMTWEMRFCLVAMLNLNMHDVKKWAFNGSYWKVYCIFVSIATIRLYYSCCSSIIVFEFIQYKNLSVIILIFYMEFVFLML